MSHLHLLEYCTSTCLAIEGVSFGIVDGSSAIEENHQQESQEHNK